MQRLEVSGAVRLYGSLGVKGLKYPENSAILYYGEHLCLIQHVCLFTSRIRRKKRLQMFSP